MLTMYLWTNSHPGDIGITYTANDFLYRGVSLGAFVQESVSGSFLAVFALIIDYGQRNLHKLRRGRKQIVDKFVALDHFF